MIGLNSKVYLNVILGKVEVREYNIIIVELELKMGYGVMVFSKAMIKRSNGIFSLVRSVSSLKYRDMYLY